MIRNHLQEQTSIQTVFTAVAQAEATGGGALTSTAVQVDDSGDLFEAGLGVLAVGQETGSPASWVASLKLQDASAGGTDWADLDPPVEYSTSTLPGASGLLVQLPFSPAAMRPKRRWVLDIDFTGGSSPKVPISMIEILSGAPKEPVA